MIRIILTLLLLITSILLKAQTESNPLEAGFQTGKKPDCFRGVGLCDVTVQSTSAKSNDISAYRIATNSIVIQLPVEKLSREDELNISGKLFSEIKADEEILFIQGEPLFLTIETLRNLGLEAELNKIAPGSYPMKITREKVEITFTLTPSE